MGIFVPCLKGKPSGRFVLTDECWQRPDAACLIDIVAGQRNMNRVVPFSQGLHLGRTMVLREVES